jgi:hypothetical protein
MTSGCFFSSPNFTCDPSIFPSPQHITPTMSISNFDLQAFCFAIELARSLFPSADVYLARDGDAYSAGVVESVPGRKRKLVVGKQRGETRIKALEALVERLEEIATERFEEIEEESEDEEEEDNEDEEEEGQEVVTAEKSREKNMTETPGFMGTTKSASARKTSKQHHPATPAKSPRPTAATKKGNTARESPNATSKSKSTAVAPAENMRQTRATTAMRELRSRGNTPNLATATSRNKKTEPARTTRQTWLTANNTTTRIPVIAASNGRSNIMDPASDDSALSDVDEDIVMAGAEPEGSRATQSEMTHAEAREIKDALVGDWGEFENIVVRPRS